MNNKNRPLFFIFILLSALGLWQFTDGVRTVDIVGLFASGALAGAGITAFFVSRK